MAPPGLPWHTARAVTRGIRRRDQGAVLATVLFTDIVSSSSLADELGDRAWKVLLDRHHAVVRGALRRHGGREIDNAGDGFFASFERPADAIRCACAIVDEVRELGLEVRAGVHTGEVERVGDKLGGIAVHVGSRVMSAAGPGQVVVSATTRDLVRGSGFGFTELGPHVLKGIPEERVLFEVTELDGAPRQRPATAEEAAVRRAAALEARPRSRLPLVVGTLAGAVVVASLAGILVLRDDAGPPEEGSSSTVSSSTIETTPPLPELPANSLVDLDPVTGEIRRTFEVGEDPAAMAVVGATVWVVNYDDRTLTRVDTEHDITRTVGGVGQPCDVVPASDGGVWVAECDGAMLHFPAEGDTPDRTLPRPDPKADEDAGAAIAVGDGSLWVALTLPGSGVVYRLDEASGDRLARIPVATEPFFVDFGAGGLWVSSYGEDVVQEIGPLNRVDQEIEVNEGPVDLDVGGGSVWVASYQRDTLTRIETVNGQIEGVIELGSGTSSVAAAPDAVWVTETNSGRIYRIDPDTTDVSLEVAVHGNPGRIEVTEDAIWVLGVFI